MKTPQALAAKLAQQWHSADWRERQLLGTAAAWPLTLPIGQPDTAVFLNDAAALRSHLQQWRAVEDLGLGSVQWQERRYRGSSDAIAVPTHWQLAKPAPRVHWRGARRFQRWRTMRWTVRHLHEIAPSPGNQTGPAMEQR